MFLLKQRSTIPGFHLALGYTVLYLSLIVLIPLSMLFIKTSSISFSEFWAIISSPRTLAAYRLSFGAAFIASFYDQLSFGSRLTYFISVPE